MSTTRRNKFALLLSTLVLAACGTAAPKPSPSQASAPSAQPDGNEPVLAPADAARAAQVGSLVMASPRATAADLDDLSKHLHLPVMLGQEAFSRMTSASSEGAKVAQLASKLDPAVPIALVWFMDKQVKGIAYCGAVTVADGVDAKSLLGEFGTEKSFSGGLSERVDASGVTLFVAVKGKTLLVANARDMVARGGALAMASQVRRTDEHIAVTIWPQALSTHTGRSFDQLAKRVNGMVETLPTPTGATLTDAARRTLRTGVDTLFSYLSQTDMIRFVFVATSRTGLVMRTELYPKPNTTLSLLAAKVSPFSFDRNLPTKHPGVSVLSWGDIWNGFSDLQKVIQSSGPKGEKLAESWRKLHGEHLSGGSCSLDFSSDAWLLLCSYDLRKGANETLALDALVATVQAQHEHAAELENRKATPLKVKKGKGTVSIEQRVETADKQALAMLKNALGTDTVKITLSVSGGKILHAVASKPVDPLTLYGKAAGAMPALVGSSLDQATGAEAMVSFEPVSPLLYLLPKLAGNQVAPILGMLSALPGGRDLHVPLLLTLRGGNSLVGELRFPIAGLETLAKVLGSILGQPAN